LFNPGLVIISMAENWNCLADSGGGLSYWISAKSVEWFMKMSFVALCKLNFIMDHYGWKMELPESENIPCQILRKSMQCYQALVLSQTNLVITYDIL
jgi:hypothetical protein